MTTTVNLRKLLHRKAWEFATPSNWNTAAGSFITGDRSNVLPQNDNIYFVNGASGIYNYNADQDAWLQLPNSGIAGSFAAGSCGEFRGLGAMGGAFDQAVTSGTTTTITTNKSIVRSIAGSKIRVISGTGIGYEGTVASNTIGANAVITVTPAASVAFDATTVFRCWSGSLWFFNAGTSAVGFSVYDKATNTWTAKSVTNLPTAWGTAGQLVATPSGEGSFESGTSTGSNTTSTLNHTGKTWAVNAWANFQVRITAGTGIGQIRTVASNTATALTVATAWTVTPDATSQYVIEGNDDVFYLMGNNNIITYKYIVSTNTWSSLSPSTARGGNFAGGGSADWIAGITDADWIGAQGKTHIQGTTMVKQNGRYIYSLRGGGTGAMDIYDIALNTWYALTSAAPSYGNYLETFTAGSCSVDYAGIIYIMKEGTGRMFRFDVAKNVLEPFATNVYPQSTVIEGDKMTIVPFKDGSTIIPFLYVQQHSRTELLRMMVI